MILCVTLNPAIDDVYTLPNFSAGMVHRSEHDTKKAGGKGINVAKSLNTLDIHSCVITFIGGNTGKLIQLKLFEQGIPCKPIEIMQENRHCILISDPINKTDTVINQNGPSIDPNELEKFEDAYKYRLKRTKIVVLSGSLPQNVPVEYYNTLIKKAKEKNIPTILDTSHDPLALSVNEPPTLLKCNLAEFRYFVDKNIEQLEEISEVEKRLPALLKKTYHLGIPKIIVTLGKDGAIGFDGQDVVRIKSPKITKVSAIGSGDAATAGIIKAMSHNMSWRETVISAVAAGAANAEVGLLNFTEERYITLMANLTAEEGDNK